MKKILFLIFLTSLMVLTLSAQTPLPFSENFNGTSMPTGWTSQSGGATFYVGTSWGVDGSNAPRANVYGTSSNITGQLNSPVIGPITAGAVISIMYRIGACDADDRFEFIDPNDRFEVLMRVGTGNYDVIYTLNNASPEYNCVDAWLPLILPIPATYTNQNVNVAFKLVKANTVSGFSGPTGWDAYFGVDDVKIYLPVDNDLVAVSLTGATGPSVSTPVTYTLTVRNEGNLSATGWSARLMQVGNTTPLTTVAGTTLASLATTTVDLTHTFTTAGEVQIFGEIDWTADQTATNNQSANLAITVYPSGTEYAYVGNPASTTKNSYAPLDYYYRNNIAQSIYLASEINVAGSITALILNFTGSGGTPGSGGAIDADVPVNLYLANVPTTKTSFTSTTDWVPYSDFTLVFSGVLPVQASGSRDITIPLATPFPYTGENLVLMGNRTYTANWYSESNAWQQTAMPTARTLYVRNDTTTLDITNPGTGSTPVVNVPNIGLAISTGGMGHVSGTAYHNGTPLAGVLVTVGTRTALTNASGVYTIQYLPEGTHNIVASKHGFVDNPSTITITENNTATCDFTMQQLPTVIVSGTILASDTNAGLADATVELTGYDNYTVTTNASGVYTINGVYTNQTYDIKASAVGYTTEFELVEVGTVNVTVPAITLLEKTSPATQVRAELEGNNMRITWSEPAGEVEVDWFAAQDYDVVVGGFNSTASNDTYQGAHRFTAAMLNDLGIAGGELAKVAFAIGEGIDLTAFSTVKINIYTGGYADTYNYDVDPGTLVYSQDVDMETINTEPLSWTEVTLEEFVSIPTNVEMWIAVQYFQIAVPASGMYQFGFGQPAVVDFTDLTDGFGMGGWFGMYWDAGYDIGWAIKGGAVSRAGAPVEFSVYDVPTSSEPRAPRNIQNIASNLPTPSFAKAEKSAANQTTIYRDMPTSTGTAKLVRHENNSTVRDTRALTGFNVYRINLLTDDINDLNTWDLLASGLPAATLTYLDNAWTTIPDSEYRYAVVAIYTNGVQARAALSNIVYKGMTVSVTVNITTYNNSSATGAIVKLTNVNGNPSYVYTATATGNTVNFNGNVWRGYYNVSVTKTGFGGFSANNVDFTSDTNTINVHLGESGIQLEEGFETMTFPPTGWLNINGNNNGFPWFLSDAEDVQTAWGGGFIIPNSGVGFAASPSWWQATDASLYADNWLITPMIANLNMASTVKFFVRSVYESWMDSYGVYISTTGTTTGTGASTTIGSIVGDFTLLFYETAPAPALVGLVSPYVERTVDLAEYAGNDVYIAFRHYNTYDKHNLCLDDIKVEGTIVSDGDIIGTPRVNALQSNYPNPFNPSTTIAFDVARDGNVSIEIYNVKGQKVKTLVNDYRKADRYTEVWNGTDENGKSVSSGIYFYKMTSGDFSATKKMIMMK